MEAKYRWSGLKSALFDQRLAISQERANGTRLLMGTRVRSIEWCYF